MQVVMTKPGRVAPMVVYSQRDVDWCLKAGWEIYTPEAPKPAVSVPKRPGRPRKVNEHHDIR